MLSVGSKFPGPWSTLKVPDWSKGVGWIEPVFCRVGPSCALAVGLFAVVKTRVDVGRSSYCGTKRALPELSSLLCAMHSSFLLVHSRLK